MKSFVFLFLAACGGEITSGSDASTQGDAQEENCVDLEPSMFATSCSGTSDCVAVAMGTFCAGYDCSCPSATINASSQPAYEDAIAKIPHGPSICSCPLLGSPRCISSQCVFCPNPATKPSTVPPGCPKNECEAAGFTCKPVSQNQCMGGGAPMAGYDCDADAGLGCCM